MTTDRFVADTTARIAELVRWARRQAGLSQVELAAAVGTTQSAVSRWERAHDEPRLSTLTAIMAACGRRLELLAEADDVDRAQIRQQLAMTPAQRLESVVNTSLTVASARRLD
ncbi:MAG: helix-turn-helix domain-containing protein [Acidimicrobiales bacterium]